MTAFEPAPLPRTALVVLSTLDQVVAPLKEHDVATLHIVVNGMTKFNSKDDYANLLKMTESQFEWRALNAFTRTHVLLSFKKIEDSRAGYLHLHNSYQIRRSRGVSIAFVSDVEAEQLVTQQEAGITSEGVAAAANTLGYKVCQPPAESNAPPLFYQLPKDFQSTGRKTQAKNFIGQSA